MRWIGFLLCFLLTLPVAAQEKSRTVGIFQSPEEYDQFMTQAKQIAYGPEGNRELRAMIPMINDIVLQQPIGATANQYDTEASTLGLLADENIRADLEMVDDQYRELQVVSEQIRNRSAEQLRLLDFTNTAELAQRIRDIREQARKELDSLLLPHQLERLQQIRMQSQLRRRSLVDLLISNPLRSELDISQQQVTELRDAEQEIEKEVQREIQQIRARAREKLLSKLSNKQRTKVKTLIGDDFEFKRAPKNKSKGESK
jgi:hypothetical protein